MQKISNTEAANQETGGQRGVKACCGFMALSYTAVIAIFFYRHYNNAELRMTSTMNEADGEREYICETKATIT